MGDTFLVEVTFNPVYTPTNFEITYIDSFGRAAVYDCLINCHFLPTNLTVVPPILQCCSHYGCVGANGPLDDNTCSLCYK